MADYNVGFNSATYNVNVNNETITVSLGRVGPQGAPGGGASEQDISSFVFDSDNYDLTINTRDGESFTVNLGSLVDSDNRPAGTTVNSLSFNDSDRTLTLGTSAGNFTAIIPGGSETDSDTTYTIAFNDSDRNLTLTDDRTGRVQTVNIPGGSASDSEITGVTFDDASRNLTIATTHGDFTANIPGGGGGEADSDIQFVDERSGNSFDSSAMEVSTDTGFEIVQVDGRAVLRRYVAETPFSFTLGGAPGNANILDSAARADFTLTVNPASGTTFTTVTAVTATFNGANHTFTVPPIGTNRSLPFTGTEFDSEGTYVITVIASGAGSKGTAASVTRTVTFQRTSNDFAITLSGVPGNSNIGTQVSNFTVNISPRSFTSITSIDRVRITGPGGLDTDITHSGNSANFNGADYEAVGTYNITVTATGTDSNGHSRTVSQSGSFSRSTTYLVGALVSVPAAAATIFDDVTNQNKALAVNDAFTLTGTGAGARPYIVAPTSITATGPVINGHGINFTPTAVIGTFTAHGATWGVFQYNPINTGTVDFTVARLTA